MKNLLKLLMLVAIIIFVSSCAGPFTIEDSGTTVNLGIDDPFEIELQGNASTGFAWQVMPYDSTIIKQVGEREYTANDDRVGSAGTYTYKFQTTAAGQTDLLLVYHRKWEEHKPPVKMFKMKIVVGTMGRILEE